MKKIDLHVHTSYSDGIYKPRDILTKALKNNVEIISITDHDTADGVCESIQIGKRLGIKVIPGIEFSSYDKYDIHILGYNINYKSSELIEYSKSIRKRHRDDLIYFLRELKKHGVQISIEDIMKEHGYISMKAIMNHIKYREENIKGDVLDCLCNSFRDRKECSHKSAMKPLECINFIHNLGGIAILAHPGLITNEWDKLQRLLSDLEGGVDGIECQHPKHSVKLENELIQYANKNNLVKTYGSDFHGRYGDKEFKLGRATYPEVIDINLLCSI